MPLGTSSFLAPQLFHDLGAEVIGICHEPTGININEVCGSTHPQTLAKAVVEHGADLGFAFDGDCDRLIAIDHHGAIVDGDHIMFVVGRYLNEKGKLVVEKQESLAKLAQEMPKYPQVLKNLRVEDKMAMMTNISILDEIVSIEKQMAGKGRVLVRPSGTEPLVRVMVEAETETLCEEYVNRLLSVVKREMIA